MSDGTVEELKAAIDTAIQEIERLQGALGVADDRADGALQIISRVSDGSGNDQITSAMLFLSQIKQSKEENIARCLRSIEALNVYKSQR